MNVTSDTVSNSIICIWEKCLEMSPVTLDSNFFELGGDSLGAVEMLTMLQEKFRIVIPLRIVFETNTLLDFIIAVQSIISEKAILKSDAI